jgi:hypothetical protein
MHDRSQPPVASSVQPLLTPEEVARILSHGFKSFVSRVQAVSRLCESARSGDTDLNQFGRGSMSRGLRDT